MGSVSGYRVRGRVVTLPGGEPLFGHSERLRQYFGDLLATPVVDPDRNGPDKDGSVDVHFQVLAPSGRECLGSSKAAPSTGVLPDESFRLLSDGARRLKEDAARPGADPVLRALAGALRFPDPATEGDLWRVYKTGWFSGSRAAVCWGVQPASAAAWKSAVDMASPTVAGSGSSTAGSGAGNGRLCLPRWAWLLLLLLLLGLGGASAWLLWDRESHGELNAGSSSEGQSGWLWVIESPIRPDLSLQDATADVPVVLASRDPNKPTVQVPVTVRGKQYRKGETTPFHVDSKTVVATLNREPPAPDPERDSPPPDEGHWVIPEGIRRDYPEIWVRDPSSDTPEIYVDPSPRPERDWQLIPVPLEWVPGTSGLPGKSRSKIESVVVERRPPSSSPPVNPRPVPPSPDPAKVQSGHEPIVPPTDVQYRLVPGQDWPEGARKVTADDFEDPRDANGWYTGGAPKNFRHAIVRPFELNFEVQDRVDGKPVSKPPFRIVRVQIKPKEK